MDEQYEKNLDMTFMLPYNSILPQETIPADQGPESVPGAGEGRGPLSAGAATDFVKESFDMSAGFLKGMANAWLGIGGDVERLTTGLMYAANPNEGEGPIDAFLRGAGKDSTLFYDTEDAKKFLDKYLPYEPTTETGAQEIMDRPGSEAFGEFSGIGGQLKVAMAGLKKLGQVLPRNLPVGLSIKDVDPAGTARILAGESALPDTPAMAAQNDVLGELAPPPAVAEPVAVAAPAPAPAKVSISAEEKQSLISSAGESKAMQKTAITEARRVKGNYPKSDGWAPIEVGKAIVKVAKDGKESLKVAFKKIPYAFQNPQDKTSPAKWQKTMSDRVVSEVDQVVKRAQAGDQGALDILEQANWYRTMRNRLRSEFGGMGDVFADVLGTTSAQTNVQQNFSNAIQVLRKFSRGEFDAEIAAYEARLKSGEPTDPRTLTQLFNKGEFPLITGASGKLFNTNSPATTGALLDMFRTVKAGDAPKTPNFTANLIGLTNEATVDVWAARLLRRVSGRPAIPPPAEQGVSGVHKAGSTLFEPEVSGEFGFGQTVFKAAADEINAKGLIKSVRSDLGDLGPDDLQAVAWFIEKEKWTANGWTTKSGEGGSLDFEMDFAGQSDVGRVKELRSTISSSKTLEADKLAAQKELDTLVAPADRITLGVSAERPNDTPSNFRQAEVAAEFDDVVRDDSNVIGYKLNSTYGRFMKQDERALDGEFVVTKQFNSEPLKRRLVEMGKQYDQDAVFMSKVVNSGTSPNARPGVEIYFKERQTPDFVRKITDKLEEYGVDGFTFVTDMRQSDRVTTQALSGGADVGGMTGVRFQYIPEFDDAYNPANRDAIMGEKQELFDKVVRDIIGDESVSEARLMWYETDVYMRDDYDVYLGTNAGKANSRTGTGSQSGADVAQPNSGGQQGSDFARGVSDRLRKSARKNTGVNNTNNGGAD